MLFSAIAATKISSASAFCSSHGPSSLSRGVGSYGVRSSIAPTGHNVFCHSRAAPASEEPRRWSRTSSSSSSLKYRVAIDIDNEQNCGYGVGSEEVNGHIDSLWREALRPTRESREGSIPSVPAEEMSAILADGVSKELALLELQKSSLGPPSTISDHHDVPPAGGFVETAWAFIPVALEFGAVAAAVATNVWN
jgi:hypothetical protein